MIQRSINERTRMRLAFVVAAGVFLGCLGAWAVFTDWKQLLYNTNIRQLETARAIALHTDDIFSLAQQPLNILADRAQDALGSDEKTQLLVQEMRHIFKTAPLLRSIAYADANGRLIESTLVVNSAGMDLSNREYFKFHRSNPSMRPYFGLPSQSQTTEKWFLPISQRVNRPDGSFAGVMVATIDIDHFVKYIETFSSNDDNAFALVREDGSILLRLPIDPKAMGENISDGALYRDHIAVSMRGNYEYVSRFDGKDRVSGFYRSHQSGVIAIATRTKRSVLNDWVNQTKYPWLSIVMTYLIGIGLAFRWVRQIELSEIEEQKVADREAEFRVIANSSLDLIEKIRIDGVREYVSPAAERLLETDSATLIGTNILDALKPEDRAAWQDALDRIKAGSISEAVLTKRPRSDGTEVWLESLLSCTQNEINKVPDSIVVITRDVTRQQKLKLELNALATIDELTGLFNKRYFSEHLSRLLTENPGSPVSLLLIDLDRFKQFNDTYGHLPGDHCLRDVARAISAALPDNGAFAARFGGEEMAVVLPGYDSAASILVAEKLRRCVETLQIPHEANRPFGVVTISIGLGLLPQGHSETPDTLIVSADQALYNAKSQGRNRVSAGDTIPENMRSTATA